ncbi:hypothetical protein [Victivallis lenta]|uniref:hypothetical protein n=1 Tax=Victivallis lenta TaxID=2606640 RepID=UPI0015AA74D0|nr:hypothetical protein [Victivallis lenta]
MHQCDRDRRDWLNDVERVARHLNIKTRVTRDYVTLEFPDRTRRKEQLKAKKEAVHA